MLNKTLAALALATSLVACHDSATPIVACAAPDVEKPGTMTMTGSATLEVSPDCADLTMMLTADVIKPADATARVQAKQTALVAALDKLGLKAGDVKLSNLTLEPIYEPNPEGYAQIKVHTYRAGITITATTHDFGQISAIMEAGAEAGATEMSSAFRNSDLPALKKRVRDMALAAVQDKAKQTATALGTHVGRVMGVGENVGGSMWNQAYFPQASNVAQSQNTGGTLGASLQPLTLDVTVTYELKSS